MAGGAHATQVTSRRLSTVLGLNIYVARIPQEPPTANCVEGKFAFTLPRLGGEYLVVFLILVEHRVKPHRGSWDSPAASLDDNPGFPQDFTWKGFRREKGIESTECMFECPLDRSVTWYNIQKCPHAMEEVKKSIVS